MIKEKLISSYVTMHYEIVLESALKWTIHVYLLYIASNQV